MAKLVVGSITILLQQWERTRSLGSNMFVLQRTDIMVGEVAGCDKRGGLLKGVRGKADESVDLMRFSHS